MSIAALFLQNKLFAISVTVEGIPKKIVVTVGQVDLALIQEETVLKQTRKIRNNIESFCLVVFTKCQI